MTRAKIQHLGQSGLKINLPGLTILIDPYLSNSVQALDSADLKRLVPIPLVPRELTDIDWVLITHDHLDHCDPQTIPILAQTSPQAKFMGPEPVRCMLQRWGIAKYRIHAAQPIFQALGEDLFVKAVPAAHPKIRRCLDGQPAAVGWLLERKKCIVYVAGDTSVCDEVISSLQEGNRIHTALLPVNEDNYFRRRRGIIGNMSIREAFGLAVEVGICEVVPVHWDLFEANSTLPAEIQAVYEGYSWPFRLLMDAEEINL